MNNPIFQPAFRDRISEDRDLVSEVCRILNEQGHPQPEAWVSKCASHNELISGEPKLQRYLINTHFRLAIGLLPGDTRMIRYHLFDDAADNHQAWLDTFARSVAPVIVEHQL